MRQPAIDASARAICRIALLVMSVESPEQEARRSLPMAPITTCQ
jgi:hypothetical protein